MSLCKRGLHDFVFFWRKRAKKEWVPGIKTVHFVKFVSLVHSGFAEIISEISPFYKKGCKLVQSEIIFKNIAIQNDLEHQKKDFYGFP